MAGGRCRHAALGKRLDLGSEVAVRLDGHKKDLLVPSLAGGLGVLDLSRRLLQPRTDDASDRAPLVEENASVGLRKIDGECDGSVERNETARNLTAHGLRRQVDLQRRDRSVDLFFGDSSEHADGERRGAGSNREGGVGKVPVGRVFR